MSHTKNTHIRQWVATALAAGLSLLSGGGLTAAGPQTLPNNKLPTNGEWIVGGPNGAGNINPNGAQQNNTLNITQKDANAVIKWHGGFNVGASGTVHFDATNKNKGQFNTLNYDASGQLSQIQGKITAEGGNIYIVNPNGVQIGNSAQINVGSLYVSNANLKDQLNTFNGNNIDDLKDTAKPSNAELMSLGNIVSADKVTFDGQRVVLDIDRVKKPNGDSADIEVKTANDDVLLGSAKGTVGANVKVNSQAVDNNKNQYNYKWIKNVTDLQNIKDGLNKNYALSTSIDAIATKDWKDDNGDAYAKGFKPIGTDGAAFTGKFDGLGFSIFGLTINRNEKNDTNTGLFGSTSGATVQNVNLIGGNVNGYENAGALIGHAVDTTVKNIKNTVNVNGQTSVGGIVGKGERTNLSDVFNDATIQGNVGVGGIAGKLKEGSVTGTSYNVGSIHGAYYTNLYTGKTADYKGNITQTDMTKSRTSKYVGGIVGDGDTVTIGNASGFQMYNGLNITAGSSVAGIAGRIIGDSTIQNVLNEGVITATDSSSTGDTLTYGKADINKNKYGDDTQNTNAGNAGGIVGESGGFGGDITISNAINRNTVQSVDDKELYKDVINKIKFDGYYAGNIGGIVGYAKNTAITNSRNENAAISGSQNVGGIAGHLDTFSTITHSVNDGGAITATGSVYWNTVVNQTDTTDSPSGIGTPQFANVGGIAGYVSYNSKIASSSNTGAVTADKRNNGLVLFGTGGVVGRIDQLDTAVGSEQEVWDGLKKDASTATVYDSYNTGKVTGDRAVGGVAGAIYNGSIANSYNEGNVITIGGANGGTVGGIVGDSRGNTADQKGSVLYNVFNKGLIGDKTLVSGGRHIGGIVGHLAGVIDGAYNIGEIYNNDSITGGIAGWLPQGSISNAFNAGTINVKSNSDVSTSLTTAAGGIIGGLEGWGGDMVTLQNIYNIGTVRAIQANGQPATGVAGIIGGIHYNHGTKTGKQITLDHVYTTGNIYSNGRDAGHNGYIVGDDLVVHSNGDPDSKFIKWNFNNVFYITPEDNTPFAQNNTNLKAVGNSVTNVKGTAHEIAFANRYDRNSWNQGGDDFFAGDTNLKDNKGRDNRTVGADWRKYDESLPILNFFRPKGMDDWFNAKTQAEKDALLKNVDEKQIQFGNVFNPFLTFAGTANAGDTLEVDASKFHLGSRDGLITTHNLTIHNFSYADKENDTPNAYSGTLAAYGDVSINGTGTVKFGAASRVYGDSVQIHLTDDTSDLTINGSIRALGQAGEGNIDITAGKVSIEGNLKAADIADGNFTIPGLNNTADSQYSKLTEGQIQDFTTSLPDREYEFRTLPITTNHNGNINVTGNQSVEILAGRDKQGNVSAGGSLNVTADTSAYVDTDFSGIKGNLDINSAQSTLDISNVSDKSFFTNHKDATDRHINLGGADSVLAFDAWNSTTNSYDLTKNDNALQALEQAFNSGAVLKDGQADTKRELFHIWVDNADELQDIAKNTDKNFLTFHYALRQDLDLSNVQNYKSIASGADEEYTGHFNGRGYSIVGLNVDNNQNDTNIGIFGTIGEKGMVKNLVLHDIDIEASGTNNHIGLLAGTNKGTIENVTVWGGTAAGKGRLGGIVGVNSGTLNQVEGNSVVNSWSNDADHKDILGGLVGENTGTIKNSLANSGLTNSGTNNQQGLAEAMGGIAGINRKMITNVTSEGVTSGIYKVDNPNNPNQPDKNYIADNVGGIVGKNAEKATIDGAYNDASVSGGTNVGGIIGQNNGSLKNAVNAMDVTGSRENLGGLIGNNTGTGSVIGGRNNGIINGNEYVGGLVGVNAQGAKLQDLNNDDSANITGNTYVGGIAGMNSGTIDAQGSTLQNTGVITGQKYVGGVAGRNTATGTISNTISNIVLNVKDANGTGNNAAQYFGGVVGLNEGTIQGGLNTGDIHADAASYVGGIIGQNKGTLESVTNADGSVQGFGNSGNVTGKNYVGGIIGQNSQKIAGTTIQNTGSVTALDGGAGGIIGENSGAVGSDVNDDKVTNHTELVNAGKVNSSAQNTTGTIGTGGIFGINNGDIKNTTMKNDVGGIVTGTMNVGGLIGYNDVNITGSRDMANTYYKNQLINNGIVVGGTVDDKGKITINAQSQNIGGLIGNLAKGTLTAGYNTGTVQGGTNVGGVVGTNAGTVSQVFSTLANGQSVKGTTNVGGVIGTNTGTLQNSYATHAVTGTTNVGNVVGDNSGTISNIYSQHDNGKLIGKKGGTVTNAYSFVAGDDSAKKVLTGDDQKKLASYDGFGGADWKNYDGNTAPMLKVFLTKASFIPAPGVDITKPVTTYNGKTQSIVVKPLDTPDTQNGKTYQLGVYLHDGTAKADTLLGYIAAGNASDTHSYQDFIQSFAAGATNLLNGTEGRNVKDLLTLWSQQIKTDRTDGVTNPNNLGYDIDNIEFDMAKRKVNISLDDITRTYGDAAIHDGKNYDNAFHIAWGADATDEMKGEVTKNNITVTETGDEAVDGLKAGQSTHDANVKDDGTKDYQ